ncbi:MAG: signal transduction histidine kinase/CheY-like chemotaxis protein [Candidatus Azotimanducaceae bacterium]|jgi:signal transduction histidine kinase/CheY-like chemotaxis protein
MPARRLGSLIIALILLVGPSPISASAASNQLILNDNTQQTQDLSEYLSIFTDDSNALGIEDIRELPSNQWQPNTQDFIHLGFSSASIWFKATIKTGFMDESDWLVHLKDGLKDEVDIYYFVNGSQTNKFSAQPNESFYRREVEHRHFVFPVQMEPNTVTDVYIKIRFAQHIMLPIELTRTTSFARDDQLELVLLAICVGLMLVMFVYNFFLYLATREISYLFYVGLVAFAGLYFSGMNGLNYQFLWPEMPRWNEASHTVFGGLMLVFAGLFTLNFLHIEKRSRRYYLLIFFACIGLCAALLAISGFLLLGIQLATVAGLCSWITFFILGVQYWRSGLTYAGYYTVAWFMLLVTGTSLFLGFLEVIPFSMNLLYASQVAFMIETVLNSIALAGRIRSLELDKQQALSDNKAKLAFLAKMSHELRTPMNGILGMAELLADRQTDKTDKTDKRYVQIIKSSTTTLITIINDILDYSKIEDGKMELELIDFDLRELIDSCLSIQAVQTFDKPFELIASVDTELPGHVRGDPTRVGQILLNLTSNAIKFTEQGMVIVRAEFDRKNPHLIRISVKDTGIGISHEQQAFLFDSFQQASASVSRTHGGTGLGLSITKQLTELMGGKLKVRSKPGLGSVFSVTLDMPASAPAPLPPKLPSDCRLLYINNNLAFGQLLTKELKRRGLDSISAENQETALAALNDAKQRMHPVKLLIVDCGENSVAIAENLRARGYSEKTIIFSETGKPEFENRHPNSNYVSTKPLSFDGYSDQLASIFDTQITTDKTRANKLLEGVTPDEASLNILVAEDNAVNQIVIKGLLKKLNHTAIVAENGQDAVARLKQLDQEFDIVLMDCEMPVMDGFTATSLIRDWEQQQSKPRLPIVALTAHILPEQEQSCYDAGMDDLLTKPVEITKLKAILQKHQANVD